MGASRVPSDASGAMEEEEEDNGPCDAMPEGAPLEDVGVDFEDFVEHALDAAEMAFEEGDEIHQDDPEPDDVDPDMDSVPAEVVYFFGLERRADQGDAADAAHSVGGVPPPVPGGGRVRHREPIEVSVSALGYVRATGEPHRGRQIGHVKTSRGTRFCTCALHQNCKLVVRARDCEERDLARWLFEGRCVSGDERRAEGVRHMGAWRPPAPPA